MAELEVFIDDSGNCETCLSFTALCMEAGTSTLARQLIAEDVEPLLQIFKLEEGFELHGTELLREGALKNYQREFFFRHCLETIAAFPTLVIATVHWSWHPAPFRHQGQPAAWRHRLLWTRLLEMLEHIAFVGYEEPHDVVLMTSDRSTLERRLLEVSDDYARERASTRVLCRPRFEESAADRLLQMADLCAYAADLHARPFTVGHTRLAKPERDNTPVLGWDWYPRVLQARFPHGIRGGIRRLKGSDATK